MGAEADRDVTDRRVRLAVRLVLAGVAIAVGALLLHCAPFEPLSYAAWGGIAALVLGSLALVRPIPLLGLGTRRRALALAVAGAAIAPTAVLWPAPAARVAPAPGPLDAFLPRYEFRERHETLVRAPREQVLRAVREVSFADIPAAVLLMRVRAAAVGEGRSGATDRRPILEALQQPGSGFLPLDVSDPAGLVYGMVGRPWSKQRQPVLRTAEEFLAYADPGSVRVAFDLRVTDLGDGTFRVSTETRILGNDAAAARVLARYWRIIYPGSAIIRRAWLDAIAARAERSAPPAG